MKDSLEKQKFVILYKYVSYKAFESIMEKWALKASFPFESNDPLEYVAQHTEHKMGRYMNIHSPHDEPPPFFSFSRKMSDVTMWGQYADYARGICLVFKFPLSENSREYWSDENADELSPHISYVMTNSTEKCDISLAGVKYSENRFSPGNLNTEKPEFDTLIMTLFWRMFYMPTIKAESWKYEDEVRIIERCENASHENKGMLLYEWPMDYLYGVVIGANSPYPTDYIKQKIKLSYAKTNKKNFFWAESCDCYVVRASIHPTKFAYEAYPFCDRMENDLLEKVMNLTNHHYDGSETWHEISKKMLHELAERRNQKIQELSKKVVRLLHQNNSGIKEDDVKVCHQFIRSIISHSIIIEKIFKEESLIAENIQETITSKAEEKEMWMNYGTILIQCGLECIVKEIYLEADRTIDAIVANYFKESK